MSLSLLDWRCHAGHCFHFRFETCRISFAESWSAPAAMPAKRRSGGGDKGPKEKAAKSAAPKVSAQTLEEQPYIPTCVGRFLDCLVLSSLCFMLQQCLGLSLSVKRPGSEVERQGLC